jgi:hypothetical protein
MLAKPDLTQLGFFLVFDSGGYDGGARAKRPGRWVSSGGLGGRRAGSIARGPVSVSTGQAQAGAALAPTNVVTCVGLDFVGDTAMTARRRETATRAGRSTTVATVNHHLLRCHVSIATYRCLSRSPLQLHYAIFAVPFKAGVDSLKVKGNTKSAVQ